MSSQPSEITFAFLRVESVLDRVRRGVLLTLDSGDLEQMEFELPTRLRIDGIELLEGRSPSLVIEATTAPSGLRITDKEAEPIPWTPAAVLGLAVLGTMAVETVQETGNARYLGTVGWDLIFTYEPGGIVHVKSTLNNRDAFATYSDLLAAFKRFRAELMSLMLEEIPRIRTHPAWANWFPEDTPRT